MPMKRDTDAWKNAKSRALAGASAITDDDNARAIDAAEKDLDNPPLGDSAKLERAIDSKPQLVRRMRGQRGPQKLPTKRLVSLRLDPDVLDHYRRMGDGWQSRINATLREAAEQARVGTSHVGPFRITNARSVSRTKRSSAVEEHNMALEKFELSHSDGKWQFKKNGADRASKKFETKAEGVAYVSTFGNKHGNCSVRIKKTDGKIQEERTYGKDPKRSKG